MERNIIRQRMREDVKVATARGSGFRSGRNSVWWGPSSHCHDKSVAE